MTYPNFNDSLELASALYGIDTEDMLDALAAGIGLDLFAGDEDLGLPSLLASASNDLVKDLLANASSDFEVDIVSFDDRFMSLTPMTDAA